MSEYPPTHIVEIDGEEIEICDACDLKVDCADGCTCEPREVDSNESLGLRTEMGNR